MLSIDYIMTTELLTMTSSNTVGDAFELISKQKIRHIPIVDGDNLVGMVSQRDLLLFHEHVDIPLSDIMQKELITIGPEHNIRNAALMLQKHKIGSLPVLEEGRLVGIVTDTDFVGVAINLLEQNELEDDLE